MPTSVQWKRYVLYSHMFNFHIIFANLIVFTVLGNLVRHYEAIHEGIKRFHCDDCDRNDGDFYADDTDDDAATFFEHHIFQCEKFCRY